MRLRYLLIITLLTFQNLNAQRLDAINDSLKVASNILQTLPLSDLYNRPYFKERYILSFDKTSQEVRIVFQKFIIETGKQDADSDVYLFNLSDLDPNIIIKFSDDSNKFQLDFYTKNNAHKIAITFTHKHISNKLFVDYCMLGRWNKKYLEDGIRIKDLFYAAMKEYQGAAINEKTKTEFKPTNSFSRETDKGIKQVKVHQDSTGKPNELQLQFEEKNDR